MYTDIKLKSIKIREEKIGENFCDLGLGKISYIGK